MGIRGIFILYIFISFAACSIRFPKKQALPNDEIALGRQLFFDPILSLNRTISCASCHKPEFAFADTLPFSKGIAKGITARNTPSVMNMSLRPYVFWDGRAATLEEQVLHPISNPSEMGMHIETLLHRLTKSKHYHAAFVKIYNSEPTKELLGKAIAAFERTLETGDAPFDLFVNGDSNAISVSAMRGRELFIDKAHCFDCHFTPDFTADEFKNIGLFNGKELNDSGRYMVSRDPQDIGKFKVPGLRNVALTRPYMHNGMFQTLDQVIEYYNNPDAVVSNAIGRDAVLAKPLNLTTQEKADLVAFLRSLTSKDVASR
jgi:cytochrome c peroxidase